MSQKTGYLLLKEKVPEFQSPLKAGGIITFGTLGFLGIMIFFWWFDGLVWYGPIISQLIIVMVCYPFMHWFFKKPQEYRKKYGDIAFRPFFFRIVLPMFITANAGIFHVLLVDGPVLMPFWVAVVLGIFLIFIRFLLEWHIHRSGFDEVGHGFGIFAVFPEEGKRISSISTPLSAIPCMLATSAWP